MFAVSKKYCNFVRFLVETMKVKLIAILAIMIMVFVCPTHSQALELYGDERAEAYSGAYLNVNGKYSASRSSNGNANYHDGANIGANMYSNDASTYNSAAWSSTSNWINHQNNRLERPTKVGHYRSNIYEPFATSTSSDRRKMDNRPPDDPGNQDERNPIGSPLIILFFACIAATRIYYARRHSTN